MNELAAPLHLFQGYGVELEYMIVDRHTLDIKPVCDELIRSQAGEYTSEIERGELCWSNELVLHVVELKTNGPVASLEGLASNFQRHVCEIDAILEPMGAALMPTAMHPWMEPLRETKLWPHEYNQVYESYNRIFDCRGHGWSNLQSVHINLPFFDDAEFERLHAAIRLLLPIMPALAASSPIIETKTNGFLDNRIEYYRTNSKRIPSITGHVIPEPVFSKSDYETHIFRKMYRDIAPYDPEGILQFEWLNARGAIARFDRNTIEIRVLDLQECPAADLAITWLICQTIEALANEQWCGLEEQKRWDEKRLAAIFRQCIRDAECALIEEVDYAALFGLPETQPVSAGDLWRHIVSRLQPIPSEFQPPLDAILNHGSLARRIVSRLTEDSGRHEIETIYRELCDCLSKGIMFLA